MQSEIYCSGSEIKDMEATGVNSDDMENVTDSIPEKAMDNIFVNCDQDRTGSVIVSRLIEFMTPYMQQSLSDLEVLKNQLDPFGVDPKIDKSTFFEVMHRWSVDHMQQIDEPPEGAQRDLNTSTPRKSLSPILEDISREDHVTTPKVRRNLFDNVLNTSCNPTYSCGSGNTTGSEMEEELERLQHQNRKLNEELTDLRFQLTNSEEINASLQANLDRVTQRLEAEQRLNDNLQKYRTECDDLRQSDTNLRKELDKLQNMFSSIKNENRHFNENIAALETEKQNLQDLIERHASKEKENNRLLMEARVKISEMENEMSDKELSAKEVQSKFYEYQETIRDLQNTIQFLKSEKERLEKEQQTKQYRSSLRAQLHTANLLKAFKGIQAPQSDPLGNPEPQSKTPSKTQQLNTSQQTLIIHTPKANRAEANIHFDTPIPFVQSPNTSRFTFFNFDSPIISSSLSNFIDNPISPTINSFVIKPVREAEVRLSEFQSSTPNFNSQTFSLGNAMQEQTMTIVKSDETCQILEISRIPDGNSPHEYASKPALKTSDVDNVVDYSSNSPSNSPPKKPGDSSSDDSSLYSFLLQYPITEQKSLLNEFQEISSSENVGDTGHIKCLQKIRNLEAELLDLESELTKHTSCTEVLQRQETHISDLLADVKNKDVMIKNLEINLTIATDNFSRYELNNMKLKEDYEKKIEQSDFKIKELTAQVTLLENTKESFSMENVRLTEEKSSLATKIQQIKIKYEEEVRELKNNIEHLTNEISAFKSIPQSNQEQIERKLQKINEEYKSLVIDYQKMKHQNDILNEKYETAVEGNTKYEGIIRGLQEAKNTAERHFCTVRLDLSQLKEELSKKNAEIDMLTIRLNEREKKLNKISNQIQSYSNVRLELDHLRQRCTTYKEEISSLKEQILLKESDVKNHQRMIEQAETDAQHVSHLVAENVQLRTKYESLQQQLGNEITQLKSNSQTDKHDMEHLRKQNKEFYDTIKRLEVDLNAVRVAHKSLLEHLDALKTENNLLKDEKVKLNDCQKRLLIDCNEVKSINNKLQTSLKSNTQLTNGLEDQICKKCSNLQSELGVYRTKCDNLQANLCQLQNELDNVNIQRPVHRNRQDTNRLEKVAPRHIWNRKVERLEDVLEVERSKNEELVAELNRINEDRYRIDRQLREHYVLHKEYVRNKEEVVKFLSYLEETSKHLSCITRQVFNTLKENQKYEALDSHNNIEVSSFGKERFYEPHYVNFTRYLHQCTFLLKILTQETMYEKGKAEAGFCNAAVQVNAVENHSIQTESSAVRKPLLKPASFIYHSQSAPVSPKFRSKFQLPTSPNITDVYLNPPKMSSTLNEIRPVDNDSPKLRHSPHNLDHTPIELNNNISSDTSPSLSNTNTVTLIAADLSEPWKTPITNTDSNIETTALREKSEEEVGGSAVINIASAVAAVSAGEGLRRSPAPRFEDVPVRRFSNMSISASSTNSGSTESLSVDSEQYTPREDAQMDLLAALQVALSTVKPTTAAEEAASPETPSHTSIHSPPSRSRSQSLDDPEDIDIFPSVTDALLKELGLLGDGEHKEETCEQDEIERKFMALTLAFTSDSLTLDNRRARLQRHRDHAERNLQREVTSLTHGVHRLNPLCIDAERTELVTSLLGQIDILVQAARHVSNTAQSFGAVQQEWRLSESVKLMLKYVENVRLQRDTARRHFQCTRRMLQESTPTEVAKASSLRQKNSSTNSSTSSGASSGNNRLITRRRASIATISRPTTTSSPPDALRTLVAARRASPHSGVLNGDVLTPRRFDLPERLLVNPLRQGRQIRTDMAVEHLQNIHENMEAEASECGSDHELGDFEDSSVAIGTCQNDSDGPRHYMRQILLWICGFFRRCLGDGLHTTGILHELCVLCALLCFFVAIAKLGSCLLGIEYNRRGISMRYIPIQWASWNEIFGVFTNTYTDAKPEP